MNNTLYLLDGYGLIYRAYFAFIHRPLTDRDGNNVSAVHGFFRSLLALKREFNAEKIAVAMDPAGPTFRHEIYPEYKANRDSAPEDLHAQVPIIRDILKLMGIPVLLVSRYEADDVMGSVAEICRKQGRLCRLVSADKDLMQLVDENIHLIRPEKGGGFRDMGPADVLADKGVRPDQIIDYLALIGDASDNIPGVAGIGPKTASALLSEWENLENIYSNLEQTAKGARLVKLREGKKNAFFSQDLVTIRINLPLDDELSAMEGMSADYNAAAQMFRERDMRSLAEEVAAFAGDETHLETGSAEPAAEVSKTNYKSILTEEQMSEWGLRIREQGIVALDTETDSLDPMRADLLGLSISLTAGEAAYLPIRCPDVSCIPAESVIRWLNGLFADGKIRIIGQNFKYDMKVLRRAGVKVGGAWFDTMIAAWVLDASSPVGMDALADRYLGINTVKFKDVVSRGMTFADVPLEQAVDYAAEDADITWRLYELFSSKLEDDKQRQAIFRDMEMPLQPILAGMEIEGIGLDIFELEAYGEELKRAIDLLVKEIHGLCGHEFNIASPKQLQKVLFEERGLTPGKKTKTGFSTDNSVLTDLAGEDPVPEKILLYRSLAKLKSTYVDVLPQLVHPKDGRIHTSYSQTGAATGRLSSNNPNLQNIPVRDENGRRIRTAFKSRPGYVFVSADYSQIELVVLAHMSGDEALTAAFRDGVDVHARTAAILLGIEPADVSPEQRRMAKAVNFGVMYGMSAFRLSNELGISRKEAKHFIDAYFTTYRGIKMFVEDAVNLAEKDAGVRTLYGRFRPLPGINSRNRVEKAAAERAAVNSRIQGTAADILKKAMIQVDASLSKRFPDARMLLQVHDELLVEVPESDAPGLSVFLKETMESAVKLSVPLRAGVESGVSWGDIH